MLKPHLTVGNLGENFTVPKLEPLNIEEIKISNGNDLQAVFKNLSVFGPSKFNLLNLHTNVTQMQFDFDLELPSLEFFGDYSIVLNILFKIRGKGKLKGQFSEYAVNNELCIVVCSRTICLDLNIIVRCRKLVGC
jgi:hypothetical protein